MGDWMKMYVDDFHEPLLVGAVFWVDETSGWFVAYSIGQEVWLKRFVNELYPRRVEEDEE